MRCPDCSKFVSYDDPPTVEVNDTNIDGKTLTVELRVTLLCADCSTELKGADLTAESEIEHKCDEGEGKEPDFEVDGDPSAEGTSRQQTKDKHGKPIKSARYMRTYYGADITASVTCSHCEETIEVTMIAEEQASAFGESV
jgi:hypothetical protein